VQLENPPETPEIQDFSNLPRIDYMLEKHDSRNRITCPSVQVARWPSLPCFTVSGNTPH
jgi:hypothetical protein